MKSFADLLYKFYEASDAAFWIALDAQHHDPDYFEWLRDGVGDANELLKGGVSENKFSHMLADCFEIADELMQNGSESFYVGEALRTYLENGILICDVHLGNVGVVERGRCRNRLHAVVDFGHSLTLRRSLVEVDIKALKE